MMNAELLSLPVGIQSFELLRRDSLLYVDKTARLQELVTDVRRCFLSRPRRFGKSLTLSTLEAMFSGKTELFKGLAAEAWVAERAERPVPVLRLDMSQRDTSDPVKFDESLSLDLFWQAEDFGIELLSQGNGNRLQELLRALYKARGPVVVLIDEYDKPILDKIGLPDEAEAMRGVLRGFYAVLKGCDEYLRFVMLTGISKFSKTGVFSAMNNLNDISMDELFGDIVGYTQAELEDNFSGWIDAAAEKLQRPRSELLEGIKEYYDGFCFDGVTRLYNPFSVMQCLQKTRLGNYWYSSGSPSFIVEYMKRHGIEAPESYRHRVVNVDFAESQEIERACPESFLYQSGYLTIESREEQELTLDYPNREVLDSLSRMYLELVYRVEGYVSIGSSLWRALKDGEIGEAVRLYNGALAGIPYEDFSGQSESLYRSLFLMLLRGAGVTAHGEVHTHRGRSDVLACFSDRMVVLEFKLAQSVGEIDRLRAEGQRQIEEKGYAKPFDAEQRAVSTGVIVVDATRRQAVL